jgi:prepilin-type N-terminal cleavage/methylation domain-containing protein
MREIDNKKGFTLIEMLVVIAIVGIMSAVIMINPLNFQSQNSIDLVAQQVAVLIRGAQVYSGSSKSVSVFSNKYVSYGMRFDKVSTKYAFKLWADTGTVVSDDTIDKKYNKGTIQATYTLPSIFSISNIQCGRAGSHKPVAGSEMSSLEIFYQKPDPEASFYPDCPSGSVVITVHAPTRDRYVEVFKNGQITTGTP